MRPLPVGGSAEVLGIAVQTGRNGHAPGGIWLRFAIGDGLLYTGDYSTESILYAYDPPPAAGTVLLDCSYGGSYEKPLADCWDNLAPLVARGPLLLPAPANGRGPEIALMLARRGRKDIFVDDAMQAALRRLADSESVSLRTGVGDEIKRLADRAKPIDGARGVMLAASADGTSGATARLLAQWEHADEPAIVFTGYVPPGTPADRLIKAGRAQFMRWNVHPRISDTVAHGARRAGEDGDPRLLRPRAACAVVRRARAREGDDGYAGGDCDPSVTSPACGERSERSARVRGPRPRNSAATAAMASSPPTLSRLRGGSEQCHLTCSPRTRGWPMPSGLASSRTIAMRAVSVPRLAQA